MPPITTVLRDESVHWEAWSSLVEAGRRADDTYATQTLNYDNFRSIFDTESRTYAPPNRRRSLRRKLGDTAYKFYFTERDYIYTILQ